MKDLNEFEITLVSGGEINPGMPSNEMSCLNIKLMIIAGRDEPGFDLGVAAYALNKYCELGDYAAALEYARHDKLVSDFLFGFLYQILH